METSISKPRKTMSLVPVLIAWLPWECQCFLGVLPSSKLPREGDYTQLAPILTDRAQNYSQQTLRYKRIFLALKSASDSLCLTCRKFLATYCSTGYLGNTKKVSFYSVSYFSPQNWQGVIGLSGVLPVYAISPYFDVTLAPPPFLVIC